MTMVTMTDAEAKAACFSRSPRGVRLVGGLFSASSSGTSNANALAIQALNEAGIDETVSLESLELELETLRVQKERILEQLSVNTAKMQAVEHLIQRAKQRKTNELALQQAEASSSSAFAGTGDGVTKLQFRVIKLHSKVKMHRLWQVNVQTRTIFNCTRKENGKIKGEFQIDSIHRMERIYNDPRFV